jgi:hypothetical protein
MPLRYGHVRSPWRRGTQACAGKAPPGAAGCSRTLSSVAGRPVRIPPALSLPSSFGSGQPPQAESHLFRTKSSVAASSPIPSSASVVSDPRAPGKNHQSRKGPRGRPRHGGHETLLFCTMREREREENLANARRGAAYRFQDGQGVSPRRYRAPGPRSARR